MSRPVCARPRPKVAAAQVSIAPLTKWRRFMFIPPLQLIVNMRIKLVLTFCAFYGKNYVCGEYFCSFAHGVQDFAAQCKNYK
jgi:hypothetical protein